MGVLRRPRYWLTLIASLAIAMPLWSTTAPSSASASAPSSASASAPSSASASSPAGVSWAPPGLQPTQQDLTNDQTHRYGEPEIAVNPRDPNDIVYFVMSNMLTYQCEAAGDPNCQLLPLSGTPAGEYNVPGWISTHVLVSFNRGRTFSQVSFPFIPVLRSTVGNPLPNEGTDHSDLISMGDPMVTVTANGTFYLGWDSMNLTTIYLPPGFVYGGVVVCPSTTPEPGCAEGGLADGGIAVSKSIDGGRTWSTPVLTGTGVDRPWMTTDLSRGTVYEASSGFVDSSMSTGNPNLPLTGNGIPDRWVVSSPDGVHWTTPEELGGCATSTTPPTCYSGSDGSNISAAHGVLAATFQALTTPACMFFVGTSAPCTVFETSTNSGKTWSRHTVPGLVAASTGSGIGTSVLVAADPAIPGTFTVGALNAAQTEYLMFVTHDYGRTWSRQAAVVTDNPTTQKYKAWIDYSPQGVLGLVWRSVVPGGDPPATTDDYPCPELGCIPGLPPDINDEEDPPVGPYTIWAATSYDSGARFSQPLEISTSPSPSYDPNMTAGTDDTSVITLSGDNVYIGWGDWRPVNTVDPSLPGNVAGFFSAVKLQAFRFPHNGHGHHS
jgi:hypothetical protein